MESLHLDRGKEVGVTVDVQQEEQLIELELLLEQKLARTGG
jgi:hypothetical protein